eukprot:jgi/Psemu1/44116/gm1.44116_g
MTRRKDTANRARKEKDKKNRQGGRGFGKGFGKGNGKRGGGGTNGGYGEKCKRHSNGNHAWEQCSCYFNLKNQQQAINNLADDLADNLADDPEVAAADQEEDQTKATIVSLRRTLPRIFYTLISNSNKMDTPALGRRRLGQRQSMRIQASTTMESDNDDTPIPMLQILGRNKSSGSISSLTTTRSRRSCPATAIPLLHNHKADDKKPTPTLLLELDRDGGDSDEEGSLAAAFDVQKQWYDNGEDDNKNNNQNNELHVGMQDRYHYKDGTQVEEATTYPKPSQDYSPSDNKHGRKMVKSR